MREGESPLECGEDSDQVVFAKPGRMIRHISRQMDAGIAENSQAVKVRKNPRRDLLPPTQLVNLFFERAFRLIPLVIVTDSISSPECPRSMTSPKKGAVRKDRPVSGHPTKPRLFRHPVFWVRLEVGDHAVASCMSRLGFQICSANLR